MTLLPTKNAICPDMAEILGPRRNRHWVLDLEEQTRGKGIFVSLADDGDTVYKNWHVKPE